ncbi:undecaprenyldiphospho-muramoylpentapeptide beta-N-acetylglucosaminyltransferase [Paenibacillus sp. MBLB4367]|uniref:undecaprenyldiphospho-muramoylpentapeptide beta-N-acetylglucosaminyltransferase n=1 Tax=Paenibacillus sp. MBLB4367 TaxID=3384767 RepID=UPI003907FCC7
MKTIVFTGGGSAGHVTPNLALISALRQEGWNAAYIGSADGIEKQIIDEAGIPFHHISSGKLRRYFDLKNMKDPFKVLKGVWDSYKLLRKLKPSIVFSKGGFVSVPVVVAGWMRGIPVIIHESDITPGLANKLSVPFARKVCVTFPETLSLAAKRGAAAEGSEKAVLTGLPIRSELQAGSAERGRAMCEFTRTKPVLLVMGGSLGAKAINEAVRAKLPNLLQRFQIVHICGKGNLERELDGTRGYRQFEYVNKELPDLLAMTDVVVSRAGATSICEFLALQKPMVLIPLTRQASRGDQIVNAASFEKSGYGRVLPEEQATADSLHALVTNVYEEREHYIERMARSEIKDGVRAIVGLIEAEAR